ncbi:MAG TPA: hypothetical protein ENG92_03105 [Thiolapillus brandeum]|uniref:Uncharacterized protein n=1 Tax=Thiolapillus brandeum TaxID=1076588 RepID=A0A831K519_9GAMM|nr:hypothetical protein [Thiolapillus brandeum]
MACEQQQAAYEAARNHVIEIRKELKDYTGSDLPGDSAPSGQWPEGTNEGNAEVEDIRIRLQNAIDALADARMALNQCRRAAKKTPHKDDITVNIGVMLEDSKDQKWMLRVLSHDDSLDYVIVPDNLEHMLKFFSRLSRQGIHIKKLVLMGHGSKTHTHIGRLQPVDIDIDFLRNRTRKHKEYIDTSEKKVEALERQLKKAINATKKRELKLKLENAREELESNRFDYQTYQKKLELFDEAANAFAKDSLIGLFSCYAAYDNKAKTMMYNLGKAFLERNGGTVVGFTGFIWTPKKIHPLIAALAGSEDVIALPTGEKIVHHVRKGRCGKPCKNFRRYGYCDHPRAKDGGPCWIHR